MKRTLFFILSLLTPIVMMAGDVTPQQALEQAKAFVSDNISIGNRRAAGEVPNLNMAGTISDLYVINVDGGGFVIVANDDCAESILGYGMVGAIDINNIPCNMQAWLQGYADEIAWAKQHGIKKAERTRRASATKTPVQEILVTEWNQNAPFNNLTPLYDGDNHSATGCVATAMAQVMYHHQWPAATTADIPSYTTKTKGISVDGIPSGSSIDWNNIIVDYRDSYTLTQGTAVATLMKYCGVSLEMNYNSSSGTSTHKVANALKTYFGYKNTTTFIPRGYYTYKDWIDIIYHEMVNGRPVVYGGSSSGGGHAFVVDGYQSEDYFHINWGWGGMSNEYFKLSALTPNDQGIGGSSSTDGYNSCQQAIIGIQKPADNGEVSALVESARNAPNLAINSISLSPSTITFGESTNVTYNVTNNGSKDFEGDIIVGNYLGGDNYVVEYGKTFQIKAGETKDCTISYTHKKYTGTIGIVAFLANDEGSYTVALSEMAYLTINQASGDDSVDLAFDFTVDHSQSLGYSVHFTDYTTAPAYYLYDNVFNATVTLTNSSASNYKGALAWCLIPMSEGSAIINTVTVNIPAGQSKQIPLTVKNLDFSDSYLLEAGVKKDGSTSLINRGYYSLQRAIYSYAADGTKTLVMPSGTSYDAPANALAIDVTGTNVASITPNGKANAIYIHDGSVTSGLDGKNVVVCDNGSYTADNISITDGQDFYSPVTFTAETVEFTYNNTKQADGSNGWNTIMLPFNVTKVTADGEEIDWFHSSSDKGKQFWVKKFVSDDAGTVNFDFTAEMQANTPYIIALPGDHWGAAFDLSAKAIKFIGETVDVSKSSAVSSVTGSNYRFIGGTMANGVENIYPINAAGNKFEKTNGCGAFRAYFKSDSYDANYESLSIGNAKGTTGLDEKIFVNNEQSTSSPVYNLNGQRVIKSKKGLYIVNGKKVIIK